MKQVMPTFIGIGATRSGSSWLHEVIKSHPDIYVPKDRKELRFFDQYYERGLSWYASFFEKGASYTIRGEFSPLYLDNSFAPSRIKKHIPDAKLILIVRNPIDRLYSQYQHGIAKRNTPMGFEAYYNKFKNKFEKTLYDKQYKRWLTYFSKKQIHVIVFEEAVTNPETMVSELSEFLGVSKQGFDSKTFTQKVNRSYAVKYPGLYSKLAFTSKRLRKYRLDWIVNVGKAVGVTTLFKDSKKTQAQQKKALAFKKTLIKQYTKDMKAFGKLSGKDISVWFG